MSKLKSHELAGTPEERVAQSMFAVEADDFGKFALWQRHAAESRSPSDHRRVRWKQVSHGWLQEVGKLDKRPVYISLQWAFIEDQLVLFWYPTSQVVDHVQIDAWFDKHFKAKWDKDTRRAACDALNFHLCLNAVDEANEKEAVA